MTERHRVCPFCKEEPVIEKLELNDEYVARCGTEDCRCHLYCMGTTVETARDCWDGCIRRRDYR